MANIQSQPLKLFACDIVRYSDAELDQHLESNGRSEFFGLLSYFEFAKGRIWPSRR